MEKCNFGQMSWKCPGIYFGAPKCQEDKNFHLILMIGEREQDNPKIAPKNLNFLRKCETRPLWMPVGNGTREEISHNSMNV